MAMGLYEDDPLYKTSQQARRGLSVYDRDEQPLPTPPRMAVPTDPINQPVTPTAAPVDPMLAAGYTPLNIGARPSGAPLPSPGLPDADPAMIAAGYTPLNWKAAAPASRESSVLGAYERQWEGSKGQVLGGVAALARGLGATGVQQWGEEGAAAAEKRAAELDRPSASPMNVWEGKEGATWGGLGKEALGTGLEIISEGMVTALAGAGIGALTGPAAPVATPVGAAIGFTAGVARAATNAAAKSPLFRGLLEKATAFEVKKLTKQAAAQGVVKTQQEIGEQALRNVIKYGTIGAALSGTKSGVQGIGDVYDAALEQSEKTGEPVDMAKVYGYGLGVGMMDFATDMFGVSRLLKVGKGKTRISNATRSGAAVALTEGTGEGVQDILSAIGAGEFDSVGDYLRDPGARRRLIDSVAMGAIVGGGLGGAAGVTQKGTRAIERDRLEAEADAARRAGQVPELPEEEFDAAEPGSNAPPRPQLPAPGQTTGLGVGLTPTTPTEGVAASVADQNAASIYAARDRVDIERALREASAAHNAGESSGNARVDVAAAIREMTGAAQAALDSIGQRPGIYNTIGAAQADLNKLVPKPPKGGARGLQPPEATPPTEPPGAPPVTAAPATTAAAADVAANAPVATEAAFTGPTIPEPTSDITAQITAMMDPNNPKDSVFIAEGTPLPENLPQGLVRVTKPEGVYLTTNLGKARSIAGPNPLTDQERAAFLGIPESKTEVAASPEPKVAVTAEDQAGNVVAQAATTPTGPNITAVADQTPPGGTATVTPITTALGERALKAATEQATTPAGVDPAVIDKANDLDLKWDELPERVKKLADKAVEARRLAETTEDPALDKAAVDAFNAFAKAVIKHLPAGITPREALSWYGGFDEFAGLHEQEQAPTAAQLAEQMRAEEEAKEAAERAAKPKEPPPKTAEEAQARTAKAAEKLNADVAAMRQSAAEVAAEGAAQATLDLGGTPDTPAAKKAKATSQRLQKEKEAKDAVQEPRTAELFQQEQEQAGEAGGERRRVEQEQQGEKAAPKDEGKPAKVEDAVTEMTFHGVDGNGEPATLHVFMSKGKMKRAELHTSDGATMQVSTKRKDTLNNLFKRLEDDFTLTDKAAPPPTPEPKKEKKTERTPDQKLADLRKKVYQTLRNRRRAEREIPADASREDREKFVNQYLVPDWGVEHSVTLVDTPQAHAATVEVMEALTGQKVQFYTPASKEMDRAVDGFVVPGDPDTIYVSVNSKRPAMFIIGHEIAHNISELRPDLWIRFMKEVATLSNDKAFDKYFYGLKKKLEQEAKDRGQTRPTLKQIGATATDEWSANAMAHAIVDDQFWKLFYESVPKESQPLVIRILEEIAAMLRQIMRAMLDLANDPNIKANVKKAEQKANRTEAEQLFTDVSGLHRAVRDLLHDFRGDELGPMEERAEKYYTEKYEPDPTHPTKPSLEWQDLSDAARSYWIDMYSMYFDGTISQEDLTADFDRINEREIDNQRDKAASMAVVRKAGYTKAETIWNKLSADEKTHPDFKDLNNDHKNHFIRAVYDNEHNIRKVSPAEEYDKIIEQREKAAGYLSEEQKRVADIAAAQAKEAKQKAAAKAKAEKADLRDRERRAAIKALVDVERPAIEARLQSLTPRDLEILGKHFNTKDADRIRQRLKLVLEEVLVDPKAMTRGVPEEIRPVVRRVVGGVKYSRVAHGMEVPGDDAIDIDTPAFQRWFAESKVVDEKGEPLVLYHGSDQDLDTLKPSVEGALGAGIYLTPDPDFAASYADREGGNVLPLYASLQKPLVINAGNRDPMFIALVDLGMDEQRAERLVEKAYEDKGYITTEVKLRAQRAGYDGLMQYRDGKLIEVVAFRPGQVKSAVSNVGTYDAADRRIRYSRSPEPRITGTGKIVGAPTDANSPRDRAQLVRRLTKLLEHPFSMFEKSKTWYEDSGADIARLSRGDPVLREKLIRMVAFFSAGAGVGPNTTFSIRAIAQVMRGEKIASGMYPNVQSDAAQRILDAPTMDTSVQGVDNKLMNFYRNLKDAATGEDNYDNASTLDRWMMRLFGYKHSQDEEVGGSQSLSDPQYLYGKDIMHRVADAWEKKTGERLKPRQIQAVLWTYIKNSEVHEVWDANRKAIGDHAELYRAIAEEAEDPDDAKFFADAANAAQKRYDKMTEKGFTPKSMNYSDYFSRASANVNFEIRPSTSLGSEYAWMQELSQKELRELSNLMHHALLDENGRDELMAQVGLSMYATATGTSGSWEGRISPNFVTYALQDMIAGREATKEEKAEGIKKIAPVWNNAPVNLYADALGYLFRQDVVFWFRPDSKGPNQGVVVRFDDPPADIEDLLYSQIRAVTPSIELTRDGNSIIFVNTAEKDGQKVLPDAKFKKIIREAVEAINTDDMDGEIGITTFRTEANFHVNDWKKNPDGEDYRSRISQAGRPDLLAWLDNKRRQIDGIATSYGVQRVGRQVRYSRVEDQGAGGQQAEARGLPERGGVRRGVRVLDEPSRADTGPEPIQGLPEEVVVDGKLVRFGPFAPALRAAQAYMAKMGLPYARPSYHKLNRAQSVRIADAFTMMPHMPNDPLVKESYEALAEEVIAQWKAIKATGLKVEFIQGDDPYGNPRNAILDVVNHNHLWVYPTDSGFGSSAEVDISGNPLLEIVPGERISGHPVRVNDLFRIVHDYFGHVKEGIGFRAEGEDNAWSQHAVMFSDTALGALTTETRGQNSWVNFGPHRDKNATASAGDTTYADQKTGLMPNWTWADAKAGDHQGLREARVRYSRVNQLNPIELYAFKGDKMVGKSTFNIPHQTWFVYKAGPSGDVRNPDFTTHTTTDKQAAHDMHRGPGVRLVRRKESPLMQGQHDIWPRGPDALVHIDATPKPSNNWFVKKTDEALKAFTGKDVRRTLRRQAQDAFIDVQTLQQNVEGVGGRISVNNNVYQKITLNSGRTGEALDRFHKKHVVPMDKHLEAAMRKGATIKDIDTFLIAQHAEERNKMIAARTQGAKLSGSGMTTADARRHLRMYVNTPYAVELQSIGAILDDISEEKIALMEKFDLIDADAAAGLRGYDHYRALKGLDSDDSLEITGGLGVGSGTFGKSGSLLKYALGRDSTAKHVISHTLLDAQAKIVRAYKNDTKLALAQLAEDFPDPDFWVVNEIQVRKHFDPETGTIKYVPAHDTVGQYSVTAFKNGQAIKITLKEPTFAEALVNAGMAGDKMWLEGFRRWNKYLSMMMTTLSPEWALVNMGRDVQTAFFNLKSDEGLVKYGERVPPGIAKRVGADILTLRRHKDVYKAITDPHHTAGFGGWYQELAQMGGITRFFSLDTLQDRVLKMRNMEERLKKSTLRGKLLDLYRKTHIEDVVQWMEDVNAAIEAAPRVITYKALVDAGWSKDNAAEYVKNMTTNFQRKGSNPYLAAGWLFFNPSIQGMTRIFEALKSPTGKRIFTGLFAMGAVAGLTGNSGGDDDDNGIPDYQQLSDWDRATNFIPFVGGPKIPIPYGWNAPYAMGNFAMDAFFGRSPMSASWAGLKAFVSSFNPLGGSDSQNAVNWLMKTMAPTTLDPLVEFAVNENRFGSKIYREQPAFGPKQPDSQSGKMGATWMSKQATAALNKLGGGSAAEASDVLGGVMDINPDTIDWMFGQVFPGVPTVAAKFGSTLMKIGAGEETESSEYPFWRRGYAAHSKGKIFERLDEAKQQVREFQNIVKNGEPAERAALAKSHPGWGAVEATFTSLNKEVSKLQKRKADIIDDKIDVPDEAAEKNRINAKIEELNNRMLKKYNEAAARW